MDRRQDPPVITTEGQRAPPSAGERLAVGLAALALLGGALLIVGRFLPSLPEDASAHASATPTVAASRTPRPTRSPRPLREVSLEEGTPEPVETDEGYYGWIRALVDVPVLSSASEGATAVGQLAAGAAASVHWFPGEGAEKGWLYVEVPEPGGWILERRTDGSAAVERVGNSLPTSGDVWALSAGGGRYVALVIPPGTGDRATQAHLASSSDGLSWTKSDGPVSVAWGPPSVAFGPAGWLVVMQQPDGTGAWIWQSDDGSRWRVLGRWPSLSGSANMQLIGSALGYVLVADDGTGGTPWFSEDGFRWFEGRDPGFMPGVWLQAVATPVGFYLWDANAEDQRSNKSAAFSPDGRTWSQVEDAPTSYNVDIGAVDAGLLAIESTPDAGDLRAWRGTVTGATLEWSPAADLEERFGNAWFLSMAADSGFITVLTVDRGSGRMVAWQAPVADTAAGAWRRISTPEFGTMPTQLVAQDGGLVVVGARPTSRGTNPLFWAYRDGVWISEPDPLFPVVEDPSPDECPPLPRDALDLTVVEAAVAPICYGSEPITVRAWAGICPDCYGGEPSLEPAWLAWEAEPQLYLSPVEGVGWGINVAIPPGFELEVRLPGWVEVTGHFDDPAAATCRPVGEAGNAFPGERKVLLDACRQRFVLEAIAPAPSP